MLGVQTGLTEDVNKYGIFSAIHIEDKVYKVKNLIEKPIIEDTSSNVAILVR